MKNRDGLWMQPSKESPLITMFKGFGPYARTKMTCASGGTATLAPSEEPAELEEQGSKEGLTGF